MQPSVMKDLSFVAALALAACGGAGQPAPRQQRATVAKATAGELSVELLTDSRLEVGLTPVYVKVTDAAGAVVRDATVTVAPIMTMTTATGTMQHGAPTLPRAGLSDDEDYACDMVFSMPSSATDSWAARVTVARAGAAPVEALFDHLAVADTGRARSFTYTDPTNSAKAKYVASLNFAAAPVVGQNPVVMTLHRMQDMMTFAPVDDAAFTLDPQMPSMGHGSPGSVNPTLVSPGRYAGKLSFSMAGDWETTVAIASAGGAALGTLTFTTSF
ncbi:MAG: FixH family protein [Anaeromyxobacteraceae bacterium]